MLPDDVLPPVSPSPRMATLNNGGHMNHQQRNPPAWISMSTQDDSSTVGSVPSSPTRRNQEPPLADGDGGTNEDVYYSINPIGNCFRNCDLESKFVSVERDRCFLRYFSALILVLVALFIYLSTETRPEELRLATPLLVIILLLTIAAIVTDVLKKRSISWYRAQGLADDESGEGAPDHDTKVTVLPVVPCSGVAPTTAATATTTNTTKEYLPATFIIYDKIHEALAAAHGFTGMVFGLVFYDRVQNTCLYLLHHHDGHQPDNVDCPTKINPFVLVFFSMNAHVIGQPRFCIICFQYLLTLIVFPFIVSLHDMSSTSSTILWFFHAFFLLFSAILKYSEERKHRERFVAQHKLERRHAEIVERTASLRAFVLSITPPHLRSRLKNASQTVSADSSENAVCLVVHNRNVVRFMQEVLPTEGAKRLAMFRHLTEQTVTSHSFHMVRSFGDAMYFVSNLFREDHATTESAVAGGVKAATEIEVPSSWVDAGQHQLQVCCGLAVGSLTGLPVGTTCIRYDVFGPVVSEAHSLAVSSVAGQVVHVSARIMSMMSNHLIISEEKKPFESAEDNSTSSAEIMMSSTSALVSGMLFGLQAPPSMTWSSSSSTVFVPTITSNYSTQNPLYSDRSICSEEFDVMEQIGPSGGAKIIRTDISIAPSRNLQLTDTPCCWLPRHFADPTVRAEAIDARLQRSTWPFAVANVMCSVLLMVVVLIACTDDEGGVGDTSQPRYLTGAVALAVCSTAQLAVAIRIFASESMTAWHQAWSLAFQLLSLISIALLRPTLAGESGVAVHYVFLVGILSMGMGPRSMIGGIIIITLTQFLIEVFVVPRFARAIAFVPLLMFVYINAAVVSWMQSLLLHSNTAAVEEALQELEVHAHIRDAVMAAVIPPPLMDRILPSKLANQRIDVWGIDQCVSIVLEIGSMTLAGQQSGEQSATKIQQIVHTQLNLVEKSVESSPHKMLSIVKVFGNSMLIAGPLDDVVQLKGGVSAATLACTDAVHVLRRLLEARVPKASPASSVDTVGASFYLSVSSLGTTSTDTRDDLNINKLQITAAAALEQSINVLTTTAFPRYELVGTSVAMARALVAAAAPAPGVMCTEQFTKMYERECIVDDRVEFQSTERWRLRDTGSVQIRRLKGKGTL